MPVTGQKIEKALMPEKPKKTKDKATYEEWQAEAEAGYKKLCQIGADIVKEYFKDNPTGVCGSAPWGKLPPEKNLLRKPWEAFVKAVLTTDALEEANSLKQVRDAIYMGSQEVWLDEEVKKDKELKRLTSQLTYEMRNRLTLLKNGEQKLKFLVGFFGDKGQKKSLPAFIQALNLNYWSHKKCKPLLRRIKGLETHIEQLENRQPIAETEKPATLPDKPSVSAVINIVKFGHLRDLVENQTYIKFISNSQHFKKLTPEAREELLSEINWWKTLCEYSPKALPILDMFYHVLKASANL